MSRGFSARARQRRARPHRSGARRCGSVCRSTEAEAHPHAIARCRTVTPARRSMCTSPRPGRARAAMPVVSLRAWRTSRARALGLAELVLALETGHHRQRRRLVGRGALEHHAVASARYSAPSATDAGAARARRCRRITRRGSSRRTRALAHPRLLRDGARRSPARSTANRFTPSGTAARAIKRSGAHMRRR